MTARMIMVLPETARRDPRRGEIPVMRISCPLLSVFPAAGARRSIILQKPHHLERKRDINAAWIYVEKQLQRISAEAYNALSDESVFLSFPVDNNHVSTRLILKEPKTASSVRKIFLPKTVALLLKERKEIIEAYKDYLGDEYRDYDLVICHDNGTPMEGDKVRKMFNELIQRADLKPVVFHSLRHSSTTYKLKLSGGDIKAVQGDTGHAEAAMITERYAHILDDDRRINAEKFEEMFYQEHEGKNFARNTDDLIRIMNKLQESPELLELLKGLLK